MRTSWAMAVVALAGCGQRVPNAAGLKVNTTWEGIAPDQLAYSVSTEDGIPIVQRELRPAAPAGALSSGETVVVYLRNEMAGRPLICDVQGLAAGQVIAAGSTTVVAEQHTIHEIEVVLASSSSVDGGAGDAGEDASNPRRADPPGARCELPSDCASGHCIGGLCCDSACDQPCASCALPGREGTCSPLPAGSADTLNRCADQGPESCGTNGKCDGQGNCARYGAETICRPGRCQSKTDMIAPSRCDGLGTCEAAAVVPCGPFICRDGSCTSSCQSAGDCAPDATCDAAGSCGKKGLGQPCDRGAQCASGFCVDGVCCANACAGPCRSCTSGAQPGMCKITAAGAGDPRQLCKTDPSASCGVNGTCDGQGNCALSPSGTVCAPATCSAGNDGRRLASMCDGKGTCVPGAATSCGAYRCSGAACFTDCLSDADCLAPNECRTGVCGLGKRGAGCKTDAGCMSGHCVDGVCCDSAACGSCRACNVPGSLGSCQAIAAGQPDPAKQCQTQPPSSCGYDGTCDGGGGCRRYVEGTVCVAPSCKASVLTVARTCDGRGECVYRGSGSCAPFACSGSACKTMCTSDADCCCGNRCNGSGQCM